MITIISKEGYPREDEVLVRVDYFIKVPSSEGGILIIGKDSRGIACRPKNEPATIGFYVFPSGVHYRVPVGSDPEKIYPAIYFPFELNTQRWQPKVVDGILEEQDFDDEFFGKFDLILMDESMQRISPLDEEVERIFKEVAVWGPYELKYELKNHFWGEIYRERTPALERFLEAYRKEEKT